MLAEILAQHGFVPIVPAIEKRAGTPESKLLRHVPSVPSVPTQKHEVATPRRAIVHFQMAGDNPRAWATALGAPGQTRESIITDLRERHRDRLRVAPLEETPQ